MKIANTNLLRWMAYLGLGIACAVVAPIGDSRAATSADEPARARAERPQQPEKQLNPEGLPRHPHPEPGTKNHTSDERRTVPAPDDVAAPPPDAETAESGLAWKVLAPGTGTETPGPNDRVTVRYTAWKSDGTMLDTTETKGRPRSFALTQLVAGMSLGLQKMVAGERRRLWVPESLAYAGKEGRPDGMLVFDVELIGFRKAPDPPANLDAPPADAIRTDSGLAYRVVDPGEGPSPGPEDMVIVEVNAWFPDGKLFDTTQFKNKPEHFRLDLTIPAFAELVPKMSPGARWVIWAPASMAKLDEETYVDSPMVFDLTLVRFLVRPATPVNVSMAPRDAETTITGLAYKILKLGTGEEHPRFGARVEVNYAGWTRDGEMFDSSFDHGEPGWFTLDRTKPAGWNEALMMMVVGEKRRIWIPEELAYREQKGRPQGMLVFDVELLSFTNPP